MIGKDLWWADLIRRAETEQTTAEAAVRRIMGDALSGLVPKYRSEDGFVRWGLVEREIVEVVSSLRARLAECEKNLAHEKEEWRTVLRWLAAQVRRESMPACWRGLLLQPERGEDA